MTDWTWAYDSAKWSIWVGFFIYSVYNYYRSQRTINNQGYAIYSRLNNITTDLHVLDAQIKDCFSVIYKNDSTVAWIKCLHAAKSYNIIKDSESTRRHLHDSLEHLKTAKYVLSNETDEVKKFLNELDPNIFESETKAINKEIDRINKTT